MTPNGMTKNSTNRRSAGASSQAIGESLEATVMRSVSWPKPMFRSTPKDSGYWPVLGQPRHGIKVAASAAADRDHLPQPVLPRLQQRHRARAGARPRPQRAPARLVGQRFLFRAFRSAGAG